MNITETDRGFEISLQYDVAKINAIKSIPGAYYKGADKKWIVGSYRKGDIYRLAKQFGVPVGFSAISEDNEFANLPEMKGDMPALPQLDVPLNLLREPYPYQLGGIAACRQFKRNIIGDQQGLGKTWQAIGAIASHGYEGNRLTLGPGLIICPSSLKMNWAKEWLALTGIKSMILKDSVVRTWPQFQKMGMIDVFIVNYESLKKYFVNPNWTKPKNEVLRLKHIEFLETINIFKWIIIDESHRVKDPAAMQSKLVMGICKGKEYIYECTGTPVVNNPMDLVSQLLIIDRLSDVVSHLPFPKDKKTGKLIDASGMKRFKDRYCAGKKKSSNLEELNYRLATTCFFRREKHEVLKDLPPKTRQIIQCEITNRDEYRFAENNFKKYLEQVKGCTDIEVRRKLRGQVLVQMGILKQISAKGKINAVKEYIEEILGNGEKFGLFFNLKEVLKSLKEYFPDALVINGEVSLENRNRAVERFQALPEENLIFLQERAGGVGLTLTAASTMGFIEFPWTYAACEQGEDRFHRIGTQDNVQCLYFLGIETIDEYCYELIQRKKNMAQDITGSTEDIQEEIINELLNLFNQK